MLRVCALTFKWPHDLKAHQTREWHHFDKLQNAVSAKTVQTSKLEKRKQMQNMLDKVQWGDIQIENWWNFKYLGSQFETGGDQLSDVHKRVEMVKVKQRHGKMRHIWLGVKRHPRKDETVSVCYQHMFDHDIWCRGVVYRRRCLQSVERSQ